MKYLGFLITIFIMWRVIYPMKFSWIYKSLLGLLVVFLANKFLLLKLISGEIFFSSTIHGGVLLLYSWLFAVTYIFSILLIAKELIVLIYRLFFTIKYQKIYHIKSHNVLNLIILLTSICLGLIGGYFALVIPNVKIINITLKNYPKDLPPLKIAVLADLHIDTVNTKSKIEKIVELTNSLQPDIIVIPGDIVDGFVNNIKQHVQPLKKLSAKYGVFGVSGNHEFYSGYDSWMKEFEKVNITMLEGKNVNILEDKILITGVVDAKTKYKKSENLAKNLKANSKKSELKILLSHRPNFANVAKKFDIDLQISGHTHGGMVIGINFLVKLFNEGFVSGLYKINNTQLFVANGAGIWSGFPLRLGVDSAIDLLVISSERRCK